MALPLREICQQFIEDQGIILEGSEDSFTGQRDIYRVEYDHFPQSPFEVLDIIRGRECRVDLITDGPTKTATVDIAYGCLRDYIAMLARSEHLYARAIGRRFEECLKTIPLGSVSPNDFVGQEIPLIYSQFPKLLRAVFPI